MRLNLRTTTCLAAGLSIFPALAAQAQTAPYPEEIVVTANKRAEVLVDVPAAISVLNGTTLEARGLESFADYVKAVPGLSMSGGGAPGHGQPVIRGVSTGIDQLAPTVAIYLDEIPFTASSPLAAASGITFDPDLADIQRLEVLKGPQSTLYGASAMGGIIKIVTAKPSLTENSFNARVDGGLVSSGEASGGIRASANVALVDDRVGVRIAGYDRHAAGWVSNARTGKSDVNDADSAGGRLSVRFKLSDRIETSVSALVQRTSGGGFAQEDLDPVTLKPLFGQNRYSAYLDQTFLTKYTAVSNTTNIDLGFADLTNSLTYGRSNDSVRRDYTDQYSVLLPGFPVGSAVSFRTSVDTIRKTDELRLASKSGGAFEWLAGAFYTDEHDHYAARIAALNPASGATVSGPYGNIYTFDLNAKYREAAFFGNLTYKFTDRLEATVGLRYSTNDQYFRAPRTGVLASTPIILDRSSDSKTTYLATVSYQLAEGVKAYARAASAYRPGSTQPLSNPAIPSQYGPDSLWNYEVGVKGDFLDRRLTAELSAYHIKWKDIQLNSLVGGFVVISNAGKATSDGVEFNLSYRLLPGWTVGANLSYNDARIDTDNPTIGAVAGDALPFAPKFTGNANTDYVFPVNDLVTGRVGASLNYQGDRYTALSKDPLNTSYKLPSYTTVDLRGGVDWSNYSLALRIDNLTDEHAISSARRLRAVATQNVPVYGTVIRPLTATLSLGVRF